MDIKLLHRKDSLILTTVDVMNELGIQGLSTREIAKRQGVSEATLFRHFKSKNELLIAVLDYYSQFDSDIAKSTEMKQLSAREAIEFWINSYVEYFENYPAITAINQAYDVLASDEALAVKIKEIFNYRRNMLKTLIDRAKQAGEIKHEIESENLTDIILGHKNYNCLKWRLDNFSFSLKNTTMLTLKMILDAFKP
ncbi:MAG: transcriptional regulator TetR family [Clostridia bacterium]|jgi:AcrR family transcriptional regulator|nr:transcriptional regulator TetR family [Clostridia bacterium]